MRWSGIWSHNIISTMAGRPMVKALKTLFWRQIRCTSDTYVSRKSTIAENSAKYYPSLADARHRLAEHAPTSLRIPNFCGQYRNYDFQGLPNKRVSDPHKIEGRISSVRRSGRGIYFIDVVQDHEKLQLMAQHKLMQLSVDDFDTQHSFLRDGDFIVAVGYPSVTNVGELTLKLNGPIQLVAPCLNLTTIPEKLSNRSLINSNRVLDYIVSPELQQVLRIRSLLIQAMRQYFLDRQFTEVQTPLLAGSGTGANAEPFRTWLRAVGQLEEDALLLRVAPELWLKRLVIAGFDKVFEIGPSFRNEGIDLTHNPEFYTCEFYQLFLTLEELMALTEELFAYIYSSLSTYKHTFPLLEKQLVALKPLSAGKFHRYEFIPTLEQVTGHKVPAELTSASLCEYFRNIGAEVPANTSPANLLDELSSRYIEPLSMGSVEPVFIYNQPEALSPLAKSATVTYDDRTFAVSSRFELFINGKEYVNSYEEENSPYAQLAKFQAQQLNKHTHDPEALVPDWHYAQLMEYGLPPTGGWGCGIDRLVMLFSGSARIADVLSFGSVRDVLKQ